MTDAEIFELVIDTVGTAFLAGFFVGMLLASFGRSEKIL